MMCACGGESGVMETRQRSDGSMRRRRVCERCGDKWSTIEARVPPQARGDVHVLIIPAGEVWAMRKAIDALQAMFGERRIQGKTDEKPTRCLSVNAGTKRQCHKPTGHDGPHEDG